MKRLRFAVVGTGGMGQAHVKILRELEEVELAAICDIHEATARAVGEANQVPFYLDHRELLKKEQPDAVTIATPHPAHPLIAIAAAGAGVHAFTEKPMASKLSDADAMVNAARKAGVKLGVMFQQRTVARYRKAKELIEGGELGGIYRAELLAAGYRTQAYYASGDWRGTWRGEGGGVLYNQAPHPLDVFQWLVGLPARLVSLNSTFLHTMECEDVASAVLEFPNGAHGFIHASTIEVPGDTQFTVCGDKGKMLLNGSLRIARCSRSIREFTHATTKAWDSLDAAWEEIPVTDGEAGHKACLRDFAQAILQNREPMAPGSQGVRSLELSCAMTLSSHRSKWVEIPVNRAEYDELIAELTARKEKRPGRRPAKAAAPAAKAKKPPRKTAATKARKKAGTKPAAKKRAGKSRRS